MLLSINTCLLSPPAGNGESPGVPVEAEGPEKQYLPTFFLTSRQRGEPEGQALAVPAEAEACYMLLSTNMYFPPPPLAGIAA